MIARTGIRCACIALFFGPVLAFVCNPGASPVLHNELGYTIEVRVVYSDGQMFTERLPPGASMWSPAQGIRLEQVEVYGNGELLFKRSSRQLTQMLDTIDSEKGVVWTVTAEGLSAVPLVGWRPD